MSTFVPPIWQDAIAFASRAHRHQLRKDGKTPYASHVMRVMMTVRDVFGVDDPVVLCAAVLHDTIEDTTTDYDDLHDRFGTDVADLVAALTKNMALPEEQRESVYDAQLAHADWRARLVKLADVIDNACDWTSGNGIEPVDIRDKLQRAIALVAVDRRTNPVLDRAAQLTEQVLAGELPVRRAGRHVGR